MYKKKLLLLTWLIFVLILPFLGGCSNGISYHRPVAVKGVLDLTQSRIDEEVCSLDGQWEFYWNELLEPQELKETDQQKIRYIDIPSSWNRYIINGTELSGEGYATYRLILKTEEDKKLGLKIPRMFTAYNLWVNGELIASAGAVGQSRDTMTPQYLPQVALFKPQPGENEIVIQVSNFYHRSGGILESLIIAEDKQIIGLRYKSIAYESLLFGCLMIIGAYHLALFFFRKKNTAPLYFGLFCLFIGIRTLLVGERFFSYLFPYFDWEVAHKIQTLTFYLGVPVILMFFKSVFPNNFHSRIVKVVQGVGIAFGCLVLLTPARFFTVINPAYQVFAFLVIVYIISAFIKMLIRKEKGIGLIIVGGMALILSSLNDIVFLSIWMNDYGSSLLRSLFRTGNLSSVGQLLFVFANSLVLAQRFSKALEQEEVMTAQLKEINLNLDELVAKRTEDLEKSKEKIAYQKMELQKANKSLQLLSLKDPLTGLWNRRHYDNIIQIEWNRALRHKRPISLMLLDIDYFKAYNDCYGHKAGDECLIQVAQTIKDYSRRASDLAARYGGEEFVVIMQELDKDEATEIALLLRKAIEELSIAHKCSTVSPWVTVSIGVTSIVPNNNSSPHELFLTVDKALYQAKAAGRNQVKFLPE